MWNEPGDTGPTAGALGPLIIVSGPSGSGKSTVIRRVLEESGLPLRLSVSATTRCPRPGEQNGVDYYFWTPEYFEEQVRAGEFIEHEQVHGRHYGTLRREVDPFRQQGSGVLLDIDVNGARKVRAQYPDQLSVFLRAPTLAAYEERLRQRGTEDEAAIQRRLARAASEVASAGDYDYEIINDNLDNAVQELTRLVKASFEGGSHAR